MGSTFMPKVHDGNAGVRMAGIKVLTGLALSAFDRAGLKKHRYMPDQLAAMRTPALPSCTFGIKVEPIICSETEVLLTTS